ncbi:hypothetical protein CK203_084671 [Vitis vinifera]|uniref:Uncharacterized protein n=1 Tax=Vitis vinifera TaxID=29760 RepID=A0A438EU67_VITVI|nr:hypothetical protein CK203_084671 [Vitis vinifera]
MSANKEAALSSSSGDAHVEKSVDKLNGEVVSTEKSEDNAIFFTKEQFNAGLRFPLPSLVKEFLHFTQIPPTYIHPNMGSGADELVTNLPDSTKGATKGHVLVKGLWAGLAVHPDRAVRPQPVVEGPRPG